MAEHQAVEIAAWALGQLAIGEGGWVAFADGAVSYTHLTLPTIYSV